MAKSKTGFFCQNCGTQSAKWVGQCPSCREWNTFVEEVIVKEEKKAWQSTDLSAARTTAARPRLISEISYQDHPRYSTHDQELDRVLGGGLVPGSLVLMGGEPGIGKSTLMLQVALAMKDRRILYVSGEESEQQIRMRADRLPPALSSCYLLAETQLENIFAQIEQLKPELLIMDSVQTLQTSRLDSASGSVAQVRECAGDLLKYAKQSAVPVFLIGHITKEGALAGPKVLEHMVDTVLQFEGDRHLSYRILRTVKNRFGSTSELGIYEMQGSGLRQVSNPSEILISQRDQPTSGVAICAALEGNRPLLVEVQALVGIANYGTPQRSSTGFDAKRLNMLLAVLEKRRGYRLGQQDVFLNIAGGLRIEDPAIDLAVCAAIVSSFQDKFYSSKTAFAGEVGLSGEIRAVSRIENRLAEAARLGYKEIFVSKFNSKSYKPEQFDIRIHAVGQLEEVFVQLQ